MKKLFFICAALIGITLTSSLKADEGFYVGALGGANFLDISKSHDVKLHNKVGFIAGVNAGYAWCNGFRTEAEFAYRRNRVHSVHEKVGDVVVKKHPHTQISSYTAMANFMYDFATDWGFDPYVGVGVGCTHKKGHHKKETHFADQFIAGISIPVDCTKFSLEYRLMNSVKHQTDHSAVCSVKWFL